MTMHLGEKVMSLIYYMATNKEVKTGAFSGGNYVNEGAEDVTSLKFLQVQSPKGSIPLEDILDLPEISEDDVQCYASYEDAAGIYISQVTRSKELIKHKFKNRYIYEITPNIGKFFISEELKEINAEGYNANKKCLLDFLELIRQNLSEEENIELYTCWIGEEEDKRNNNLSKVIKLSRFELKTCFSLSDKEYILVEL